MSSEKPIEDMNIYERLAKLRTLVEVMKKDKSGYNYKYTTEASILAKLTAGMKKYHVSLIPGIVPKSTNLVPFQYTKKKFTKTGVQYDETINETIISADTVWTWICDDNPNDFVKVNWIMVGHHDNASMAFGSGMSYSERYFLLSYFNISTTEDDPESWKTKQEEAIKEEDKIAVNAIIATIDNKIKDHMVKKPDDREELLKIVARFARDSKGQKSSNYNNIKDLPSAQRLLIEVNKFVGNDSNTETTKGN